MILIILSFDQIWKGLKCLTLSKISKAFLSFTNKLVSSNDKGRLFVFFKTALKDQTCLIKKYLSIYAILLMVPTQAG